MNIVVRTNGTAELDERPVSLLLEDLFPGEQYTTVQLIQEQQVEGFAVLDAHAEEVNTRARAMVVALTGAHVVFKGTVLLHDIHPEDATELLTIH